MDLGAGLMIGQARYAWRRGGQLGQKFMEKFAAPLSRYVATLPSSWLVYVSVSAPWRVPMYVKQRRVSV